MPNMYHTHCFVDKGNLMIPVITLKNATGKKITLQGMSHVADVSFYKAVIQRIKSFDGQVHLEGIRGEGDFLNSLKKLYPFMAALTGLSSQDDIFIKNGVKTGPNVHFHDVDFSVVRGALEDSILHEGINELYNLNKADLFMMAFVSGIPGRLSEIFEESSSGAGLDLSKIIDTRNEYAVREALNVDDDVLLVWGADHLPGMFKLLEDAGYVFDSADYDAGIRRFAWRGFTVQRFIKALLV